MTDESLIRRTLTLARKGQGLVRPNPMVGAIIVKNGCIVGRGFHRRYGSEHAEVVALESAREDVAGGTMYVNLEPCSHHGRQGPCTERIVAAGLRRVVVGVRDPNPLVNGSGVSFLRQHGLETRVGVLEDACGELNAGFFKFIVSGLPLFTLKIAQTIDGRISGADGNSRWISSERSRQEAHKLRSRHDAILVGIGTVLSDDPGLNVRLVKGLDPVRVVVDSRLRIPLSSKMLNDTGATRTIIATTQRADEEVVRKIAGRGADVWKLPETRGQVDLPALARKLGGMGITSVLVEGGSQIFSSLLRARLADRVAVFVAPMILGDGLIGLSAVGVGGLHESLKLVKFKSTRIGEDILLTGNIEYSS